MCERVRARVWYSVVHTISLRLKEVAPKICFAQVVR